MYKNQKSDIYFLKYARKTALSFLAAKGKRDL